MLNSHVIYDVLNPIHVFYPLPLWYRGDTQDHTVWHTAETVLYDRGSSFKFLVDCCICWGFAWFSLIHWNSRKYLWVEHAHVCPDPVSLPFTIIFPSEWYTISAVEIKNKTQGCEFCIDCCEGPYRKWFWQDRAMTHTARQSITFVRGMLPGH